MAGREKAARIGSIFFFEKKKQKTFTSLGSDFPLRPVLRMNASPFVLRVAVAADASGVTAVLARAYPALIGPQYDPSALAVAMPSMITANPALLSSGTYYVQLASGNLIVSCGGWTHEEPGTKKVEVGVAHVRHFGTHPDWIRKGLGRGIFERCRTEARAAGVHTFECYSSFGAEPFYAALGFRVVERTHILIAGTVKFPTIKMRWTDRDAHAG